MAGTPQHPPSHLHPHLALQGTDLAHLWHDGATVTLTFNNCHVPDVGCNLFISCTGSKGPKRGIPHISLLLSAGCCHPFHHLINSASPYTLEKKTLGRCNIGERLKWGVQLLMMLQRSNIHTHKPVWASLLQSDLAVLK